MPSHIFTRVGAWADSAATNRRSAEAAKKGNDKDEQMHALDYMAYAYLQLARDNDARLVMEEAAQVSGFNSFPRGLTCSRRFLRAMRLSAATGVER